MSGVMSKFKIYLMMKAIARRHKFKIKWTKRLIRSVGGKIVKDTACNRLQQYVRIHRSFEVYDLWSFLHEVGHLSRGKILPGRDGLHTEWINGKVVSLHSKPISREIDLVEKVITNLDIPPRALVVICDELVASRYAVKYMKLLGLYTPEVTEDLYSAFLTYLPHSGKDYSKLKAYAKERLS